MAINHWSLNQSTTTKRVINHLLQRNTTSACSVSLSSGWQPRSVPYQHGTYLGDTLSLAQSTPLWTSWQKAIKWQMDMEIYGAIKLTNPDTHVNECKGNVQRKSRIFFSDVERHRTSAAPLRFFCLERCHIADSLLWSSISSNGLFNSGLFNLCTDALTVVGCDGWQRAGSPQRHGTDIQNVPA